MPRREGATLSRFWTVRTKMLCLSFAMVLVALLTGGAVLLAGFTAWVERDLGRRTISIGRTVAQMPEIQTHVTLSDGAVVIQALAERVRLANNVEYVVVLNMDRLRLSHPLMERIGTQFTSPDVGPALAEQAYYTRAAGVAGASVRAFVPVMDPAGTRQVGVVVVGVLTPTWMMMWREVAGELGLAAALAMTVGLILAWLLARNIKRQMLGLEPQALARLLEERSAILDTIGEGLIAIEADGRITVINHAARRLLGVDETVMGKDIRSVVPNTRLPEVLHRGEAERDQEMLLGTRVVLTNRVPVCMRGRTVGAVATFRDKSELNRLAEELTGVTRFVESLRAQNHEFMNRLHIIVGLLHLKEYQQAIDYICSTTSAHQELTRFLTRRFCDFQIAALLMGKHSRARELGIHLEIDRKSRLVQLPPRLSATALGAVLGNLLENAMEAVAPLPPERRRVHCYVGNDGSCLTIAVRDAGPGIPKEVLLSIYEAGFSTKGATGRGIGLALVKRNVDEAGGEVSVETSSQGSSFTVRVPLLDDDPDGFAAEWSTGGRSGGVWPTSV